MEEFLKPLKMTQAELAKKLGVSYPRLNELTLDQRLDPVDPARHGGDIMQGQAVGAERGRTSYVPCNQPISFDRRVRGARIHPLKRLPEVPFRGITSTFSARE